MSLNEMIIALVFLPLLGALGAGLCVRVIGDKAAQILTAGPMVLSAILAAVIFSQTALAGHIAHITLTQWIVSGDFALNWALYVDSLTAVMLVVVTWVSAVVHVYSIGYMSHDDHKPRFMAYLSLFTFAMLMLVTADNFIQLFFGWEGVGLCSYLLIGFWFRKPEANAAAMKAFLVNRVGDFGFALGICAVFAVFGSVLFADVFAAAPDKANTLFTFLSIPFNTLDLVGILLFIGAMGKSAQFILHTWLPDAMEGPTPVSALIHAATMVTAGVFMVARCSPLFEHAPAALEFITYLGAFTAVFAASVGLVQNDIKRVIAYSTCSQLGYMFFACGVSAYSAAVFHLMTHAFFKALLFLGAGSVIHAMSGEQDMRKMGGIWRGIPFTYAYMWLGSLALAGLPLFAGYFSKDLILEAAYADHSQQGQFAFWMGMTAAFFTAFYSWRLLFMTFHGKSRADHHTLEHLHESPPIMLLPLVLLAAGALLAGYIGSAAFGMTAGDHGFWNGAIAVLEANNTIEAAHHVPDWVKLAPIGVALAGIGLAYVFYMRVPAIAPALAKHFRGIYQFLLNKWYVDELYHVLFVRTAVEWGRGLWKGVDVRIIDDLGPNGVAWVSARLARVTTQLQTGYVYHYAFATILGFVAGLSWLFYTVWVQ